MTAKKTNFTGDCKPGQRLTYQSRSPKMMDEIRKRTAQQGVDAVADTVFKASNGLRWIGGMWSKAIASVMGPDSVFYEREKRLNRQEDGLTTFADMNKFSLERHEIQQRQDNQVDSSEATDRYVAAFTKLNTLVEYVAGLQASPDFGPGADMDPMAYLNKLVSALHAPERNLAWGLTKIVPDSETSKARQTQILQEVRAGILDPQEGFDALLDLARADAAFGDAVVAYSGSGVKTEDAQEFTRSADTRLLQLVEQLFLEDMRPLAVDIQRHLREGGLVKDADIRLMQLYGGGSGFKYYIPLVSDPQAAPDQQVQGMFGLLEQQGDLAKRFDGAAKPFKGADGRGTDAADTTNLFEELRKTHTKAFLAKNQQKRFARFAATIEEYVRQDQKILAEQAALSASERRRLSSDHLLVTDAGDGILGVIVHNAEESKQLTSGKRPERLGDTSHPQIYNYVNGVAQAYTITNPDLYSFLTGQRQNGDFFSSGFDATSDNSAWYARAAGAVGRATAGSFRNVNDFFGKELVPGSNISLGRLNRGFASLKTTYNPLFPLKNFTRATGSAWLKGLARTGDIVNEKRGVDRRGLENFLENPGQRLRNIAGMVPLTYRILGKANFETFRHYRAISSLLDMTPAQRRTFARKSESRHLQDVAAYLNIHGIQNSTYAGQFEQGVETTMSQLVDGVGDTQTADTLNISNPLVKTAERRTRQGTARVKGFAEKMSSVAEIGIRAGYMRALMEVNKGPNGQPLIDQETAAFEALQLIDFGASSAVAEASANMYAFARSSSAGADNTWRRTLFKDGRLPTKITTDKRTGKKRISLRAPHMNEVRAWPFVALSSMGYVLTQMNIGGEDDEREVEIHNADGTVTVEKRNIRSTQWLSSLLLNATFVGDHPGQSIQVPLEYGDVMVPYALGVATALVENGVFSFEEVMREYLGGVVLPNAGLAFGTGTNTTGLAMSFAPSMLQPAVQVALNANFTGDQNIVNIHSGNVNKAPHRRYSANTNKHWVNLANTVNDTLGMSASPHMYRHLFTQYVPLVSPINSAMRKLSNQGMEDGEIDLHDMLSVVKHGSAGTPNARFSEISRILYPIRRDLGTLGEGGKDATPEFVRMGADQKEALKRIESIQGDLVKNYGTDVLGLRGQDEPYEEYEARLEKYRKRVDDLYAAVRAYQKKF